MKPFNIFVGLVILILSQCQVEALDTVTASPTKGPAATESTVPSVDQVATPVPSPVASPKKKKSPRPRSSPT